VDQKRDDLDILIENSFAEIYADDILGEQYNKKLLLRLHEQKKTRPRIRTAAVSLIAAGFLLGLLYTSNLQYNVINLQCKIKTDFVIMKNSINIEKYFDSVK
jgi:hypothetical protein